MSGRDPPRTPPSAASTLGYAQREVAKTMKDAAVEVAGIEALGRLGEKGFDLLIEFVRASVASPVIGPCAGIVVANILRKVGLISDNAEALVDGICLATVGVGLGTQVAEAATNIIDSINPIDIFKSGSTPANDMAPTATTIVYGSTSDYRARPVLPTSKMPLALEGL